MIRRFSPALVLAVLGLFLVLPSLAPAATLYDDEKLKLPCGRMIKVLSVSRIEYSKGEMALMVRYQTTLSLEAQHPLLSQEVDDVFKVAQKQVEHDGFREAIISSNEVPHGLILTASRMLNFIFERGSDGAWTRLGRSDFMAMQ